MITCQCLHPNDLGCIIRAFLCTVHFGVLTNFRNIILILAHYIKPAMRIQLSTLGYTSYFSWKMRGPG